VRRNGHAGEAGMAYGRRRRVGALVASPPSVSRSFATTIALAGGRAGAALRRPHNWMQLAKFCTVGATGYAVNLAVFSALLLWADWHHLAAATVSFLVAVTNNYTWNRLWTFRGQRGHVAYQGIRFLIVAVSALAANLGILEALVWLGVEEIPAQAIAIILVTPLNFVGNKLWSFRRR
jgi:putative flippase GtrA